MMGMLRDEVKLFERLSGESANDVTIERLGSFLDGYYIGKEETVKHAHWELYEDGWYCTNCELYAPFNCDPEEKGIPYCPNCGARMDEEVDNA